MRMGIIVQHDDTPCEHGRMLSPDDGMKVSWDSTVMLYVDGDVRVFEC
jgi:hypothetical protein